MSQIDVIIQARVNSVRFPYKILVNIYGKSVLSHCIDRVSRMKTINNIIVAIPDTFQNDILEYDISNNKFTKPVYIFRGDEYDVLDRYYKAATNYESDIIVRITSDCPLIDAGVSDSVVTGYLNNECDMCFNSKPRTYPLGLDTQVIDYDLLKFVWKNASTQYDREHVVPFIIDNQDKFKILNITNNNNIGNLRWTIDYPEDMQFIIEVYKRLYNKNIYFSMKDILNILEKEPYLNNINKRNVSNE